MRRRGKRRISPEQTSDRRDEEASCRDEVAGGDLLRSGVKIVHCNEVLRVDYIYTNSVFAQILPKKRSLPMGYALGNRSTILKFRYYTTNIMGVSTIVQRDRLAIEVGFASSGVGEKPLLPLALWRPYFKLRYQKNSSPPCPRVILQPHRR